MTLEAPSCGCEVRWTSGTWLETGGFVDMKVHACMRDTLHADKHACACGAECARAEPK